uniref:Uncharacterized protein n=1 Tax=Liberibacter asiaticus TaxID=34021 RepID=G0XP44_LIBAS|nr:hypothetical protein [Candidatus Liberibacter asiaticus]
MMQYNFEQSKDVSYRLFGSYFVIPWTVKDPSRIHAEVKYPDGNMEELSPERDFKVDVDESSLILSSKRWINNNNALRIFEGEKQTFKDFNIEVQKKVNQVNVLTQKMNTIDGIVNDLATQTKDVGRKLEQIDLSKLEQIDLSKLEQIDLSKLEQIDLSEMAVLTQKMNIIDGIVNDLATQTEVVGRKLEQIDLSKLEQIDLSEMAVLTQKMNIIDGIVNNLATQTKDVGRKLEQIDLSKLEQIDLSKLEQIDLSKLEGLDPQTRKYLQDIQTQLTSDTLTLQHEDTRRYASSISFKGNDGALVGWITREVIGDLKGLSIATKNQSGSLVNSVKLYDNMDVYIQGQCFIRGTDTSIFDEIKRQLKPYILGLLQGRTMVRSANLREKASIGDIITGDKIDYWAYPSENGSGYISASATQEHTMAVSAEDARKRWRIMGITRSYYYTGYWLQEVINFDD